MKEFRSSNSHFFYRAVGLVLSVMTAVSAMILAAPQPVYAAHNLLFTYTVKVETGYLALRTEKEYDKDNEIGKLYTGDIVVECPTNGDESEYRYVYSPTLHKHGYVNGDYIDYRGSYDGSVMYARVESGYLALRNAKAFKKSNEIGKLNTGDTVIILDDSDSEYWTVYAPSLFKTGYVNRNYLVYNFRAESNDTVPMVFPEMCRAEWQTTSDNYLQMHVQVMNNTQQKTITAFTLHIFALNEDGNLVSVGEWPYEETSIKRVGPGETDYSSDFFLPLADEISTVNVLIKSVRFSDGTETVIPVESRMIAGWEIR